MTITAIAPREEIIRHLQVLFPRGSYVPVLHHSTQRPRRGSARSLVVVLAFTSMGDVVNVSSLVGRATMTPRTTTRTNSRAVVVTAHPPDPSRALVQSLSSALYGASDKLIPSNL